MSLNKAILIGRLGRDPEVRYMPNGDAVCNFSLATSEKFTDKSGNKAEKTEWHNIVIYRKLAEIAGQYLKKGSQAYLEGKIQSRKYTDKNGVERTAYEIVCHEMKMLGGNGSEATMQPAPSANQEPPPPPAARNAAPPSDDDSGIPF